MHVNAKNYKRLMQQAASILEDVDGFLKTSREVNARSALEHINKAIRCLGHQSVKATQPGELLQRNKE